MYVCPVCSREYNDSDSVVKHYLKCWKEHNPHQKSKSAPHSQDITTREVNEDVMNLFSLFQKR
jgi:hypothetical protein